MRPRDGVLLILLAALAASACSRLTFIKPKMKQKTEYTGRTYSFKDPPSVKRDTALRNHLLLSQERLRVGAYPEAEQEARAALKAAPESADAYTLLAVIRGAQGGSQEAGGYYAKAAELAPAQGTALNNYGAWLCSSGRYGESLPWFDRALADSSYAQRASALANAGACGLKAGRLDRVEDNLRAALAQEPDNAVALGAMADYQYRRASFMDARAFSERRLAAAPADVPSLRLASRIEERLGDKVAAARYVQRLQTEFPSATNAPTGEANQP